MTLWMISLAIYSRFMRASMLDVLNTDYVRTARAKGLPEWRVIMGHVFRNALIPIMTVAALNIGASSRRRDRHRDGLHLDGFGFYFLNQLNRHRPLRGDGLPRGHVVIIVVFNLIADVLYGFLDPRIRYD